MHFLLTQCQETFRHESTWSFCTPFAPMAVIEAGFKISIRTDVFLITCVHKKPSALRVWIFPVLLGQRNRKPGTGTQLNFKQQEIKIMALKKSPKATYQTCFQFHALALKYKIWCFVQLIPAIIRNLYPGKRGTGGSLMSCIDRPTSMAPIEILCPAAVAPLTSQGLFLLHILKNVEPWKLLKVNAPFTDCTLYFKA